MIVFNRLIFAYSRYTRAFQEAKEYPQKYWKKEAEQLSWQTFPNQILDSSNPPFYRWFNDGKINITHNLLDRHLEANRGKQFAYHMESPITGKAGYSITIQQLHRRVSAMADSLVKNFNMKKGDTAVIYMPMILQSIIAQFACARIGVIHTVVFGGFSSRELALRIKDSDPKVLICASAGKQPNRIIDYQDIVIKGLQIAKTQNLPVIMYSRQINPKNKSKGMSNFHDFMEVQKSGNFQPPVKLQSNHPLYIIFTSGTTGTPKGIYRDHGGTAVILNHAIKNVFDLHNNDGLFCTSDIGWVLGHSFITYGPLLRGVRSVIYEGKPTGTPDAGEFWRIIQKYKINHFYSSPTAMRSIRRQDPQGSFITEQRVKSVNGVTLVGQRCDIQTFKWVQKHFPERFINDSYWQTETGSPILSNFKGFESYPLKPGSTCKPLPGYNLKVLSETTGQQLPPNTNGYLCMENPTPPSFMLSLWKSNEKFVQKYFKKFPNYYQTGDSGYYDEDGYFYVMSRVDDVINTAGHRLSTGEMQESLMKHDKVAETIVIGVRDQIKGEIPVGFVTIKSSKQVIDKKKLQKQLIALIRNDIGPVASFKICHIVQRLPKTRSGKYLRNIVRKMCNSEPYQVPSTIEDMQVVHQIESFIKREHKNV